MLASFYTFRSCRRLDNNKITSIASSAFSGLESLTGLYVMMICHITVHFFSFDLCRRLNNNKITSIASDTFTGLGSLTDLYAMMLCHVTA